MSNKPRIMIVEDEIIYAMSLKIQFERRDFEILDIVSNSEDAMALFLSARPDVILMDIRLAKNSNGIEISKKIRAKGYNVPIIFMTGYEDEYTRREADAVNPAGFFTKPVDIPDIVELISEVLSSDNIAEE